MNVKFVNLDKRFENGKNEFLKFHNINTSDDGILVVIDITNENILKILKVE